MRATYSADLIVNCLRASNQAYQNLSSHSNEETGDTNKYGDSSLGADIILGNSVIDRLKEEEANVKIYSEESVKAITIGKHEYTVFLDDLDGSAVFKDSRGIGRYGTMMAIFKGQNPTYRDYIAAGVMEHSPTPRLFYAEKSQGAFAINNLGADDVSTRKIHVSQSEELAGDTIVHCDTYFEIDRILGDKVRSLGIPTLGLRAAETQYVDVAEGTNQNTGGEVVAGIDCTRKGNLETIIAYGLIKEAGGNIYTSDGNSIENQNCLTFEVYPQDTSGTLFTEQSDLERTPLITAANPHIINQILKIIN